MKTLTTHINESIKKPIFRGNIKQSSYQPVDLGLSVKWCACNVGATKPEDSGLLFQWGRTDGYKYDDENHGFLSADDYVATSGTTYKPGEALKPEDDPAHVIIGGNWRMPTKEEMEELYSLPRKWTELNGIKGYEITGNTGNNIFIPASGYFYSFPYEFENKNSAGALWISTNKSPLANTAYYMYLDKREITYETHISYTNGFSVRAVCK